MVLLDVSPHLVQALELRPRGALIFVLGKDWMCVAAERLDLLKLPLVVEECIDDGQVEELAFCCPVLERFKVPWSCSKIA